MDAKKAQQPQMSEKHHINKIKDKNHTITPTGSEKVFDKIQHPFIIKTLKEVGIAKKCLNIINTIHIYIKYNFSQLYYLITALLI